ncbi:MAG TPA: cell division protein FtsZ [Chitinophagales bacterium]|nr:cell division protein FtsZ [Chitinophagales bacterium]
MSIQFDLPQEQASIIKVIGVGGGGGNAVNHMFRQGIVGVNFVVANTDRQALEMSPVPNKIQLGTNLTEGRGAGMNPEVGKRSALESVDALKAFLEKNTKMLFITAGMGKGTGTGAAPVIAKIAKEMGILTVGLITSPFSAEGPRRFQQASDGISEMKNHVDTLLVISNDKLREIHGNLTLSAAFSQADNILSNAAKSIAEIITVPGYVNVDFEDVNTVMRNSGVAIMGMASFEGENRAINAVETALSSPLLNDNDIRGAKNILVNITSGSVEVTLDEVSEITEYIQREAGFETNIIWGNCYNETMGEKLSVTVIATGFEATSTQRKDLSKKSVVKHSLESEVKTEPETAKSLVNEKEQPLIRKQKVQLKPERETEREVMNPEIPFEFDLTEKSFSTPTLKIELQEETLQEPAAGPEDFVLREKQVREILEERQQPVAENQNPDLSKNVARDRVSKLKNLSFKLTNPAAINEMEKEPAYLRRGINLKDVDHSSESNLSPYYVENSDDPNKLPELKKNNSFLHGKDRVD